GVKDRGGDARDDEFDSGQGALGVVVQPEEKDQARGNQDVEQPGLRFDFSNGEAAGKESQGRYYKYEARKDGDAAEPRNRRSMNVVLGRTVGRPSTGQRMIADQPCQKERKEDRCKKPEEIDERHTWEHSTNSTGVGSFIHAFVHQAPANSGVRDRFSAEAKQPKGDYVNHAAKLGNQVTSITGENLTGPLARADANVPCSV